MRGMANFWNDSSERRPPHWATLLYRKARLRKPLGLEEAAVVTRSTMIFKPDSTASESRHMPSYYNPPRNDECDDLEQPLK